MTTFIIFRHGTTDWNIARRVMGKTDIPLNDTGRKQAAMLAQRLRTEHIDAFYSSPLSRALETTTLIAKDHEQPVFILPELAEMDLGDFEGKTKSERIAMFPEFDFGNDEHRIKMKMETFEEHTLLLQKTIHTLTEKHMGETIAIGTHDQKMKALLIALGMPEQVKNESIKNCAVSIIEKSADGVRIICHNDNNHLEDNI